MLSQTEKLALRIRRKADHLVRLHTIKDTGKKKTCYIIGCGSSLNCFSPELVRERLKNELTIAMKQAYLVVGPVADYHCLSRYKYVPYDYSINKSIVVGFYQNQVRKKPFPPGAPIDIAMPLVHGGDFSKSVTVTNSQADWTFAKSMTRKCGPGMLYELGFYLAHHLGVNRIVTLGVDFDRGPHFYANDQQVLTQLNRKPEGLHGHTTETKLMVEGIPAWRDWLLSCGIAWQYVPTTIATPLAQHLSPCPDWAVENSLM